MPRWRSLTALKQYRVPSIMDWSREVDRNSCHSQLKYKRSVFVPFLMKNWIQLQPLTRQGLSVMNDIIWHSVNSGKIWIKQWKSRRLDHRRLVIRCEKSSKSESLLSIILLSFDIHVYRLTLLSITWIKMPYKQLLIIFRCRTLKICPDRFINLSQKIMYALDRELSVFIIIYSIAK